MRFRSLCVAGTLLLAAGLPARAQLQPIEKASITVRTDRTAYVPGESFRLLAQFEIESGWHVHANPASYDYLIPTQVEVNLPTVWPEAEIVYPPGEMKTFAFAEEPLSVFEGTVVVQIRSAVPAGTPDGTVSIPVTATYQACDNQRCLPPVTKVLTVDLLRSEGSFLPAASDP